VERAAAWPRQESDDTVKLNSVMILKCEYAAQLHTPRRKSGSSSQRGASYRCTHSRFPTPQVPLQRSTDFSGISSMGHHGDVQSPPFSFLDLAPK